MTSRESTCPPRSDLAAFQANALAALDCARIEQHVESCADCQKVLGQLTTPQPTNMPTRASIEASRPTRGDADSRSGGLDDKDLYFLNPPEGADEIGRLANYRVLRVLGKGGMGIVFQAEDIDLHRLVALKVLRPDMTDESYRQRFVQEGRLAASLSSDHIVTLYQVGEENGVPYLAMEYLPGETLEDRLRRDKWLPLAEALRITREVAEGLREAHERGLIHRDIKPANILLVKGSGRPHADNTRETAAPSARPQQSRAKILDFGLAKQANAASNLTIKGVILGTPRYMAPEQISGQPCDGRTDLFSLGSVLFCMLTGKTPFESEHTRAILKATVEAEIPQLEGVTEHLPLPVVHILQDLLARDPKDRMPSAVALIQRITDIEKGNIGALRKEPSPSRAIAAHTRRRHGVGVWLGAAAILGACLFGGVVLLRQMYTKPASDAGDVADDQRPSSQKSLVPAGSAEPIRVGILHSLTGVMARSETPVLEATRLAIEEINEAGGIAGKPLEVIEEDGASNPNSFRQKANKLIVDDRVQVLFGCWTPASCKAVREVLDQHGALLFYPLPHGGLEESKNIVHLGSLPNQQVVPALDYAVGFLRRKRIFLVGSDQIHSHAIHQIIRDEIERHHHGAVQIVGERYLPPNKATGVEDMVRAIADSGADLILNSIDGVGNQALFQELRAAGVLPERVPVMSFGVGENELRDFDLTTMTGDYAAANYFMSIDSAENRAFITRFQKRYGKNRVTSDPMATAYTGVKLWADAVRAAGKTDRESICNALKKIQLSAPGGPLKFASASLHPWNRTRIGQITSDGQFNIVFTGQLVEPKPFHPTRTPMQWQTFLDQTYNKWGQRWENAGPPRNKSKS